MLFATYLNYFLYSYLLSFVFTKVVFTAFQIEAKKGQQINLWKWKSWIQMHLLCHHFINSPHRVARILSSYTFPLAAGNNLSNTWLSVKNLPGSCHIAMLKIHVLCTLTIVIFIHVSIICSSLWLHITVIMKNNTCFLAQWIEPIYCWSWQETTIVWRWQMVSHSCILEADEGSISNYCQSLKYTVCAVNSSFPVYWNRDKLCCTSQ